MTILILLLIKILKKKIRKVCAFPSKPQAVDLGPSHCVARSWVSLSLPNPRQMTWGPATAVAGN